MLSLTQTYTHAQKKNLKVKEEETEQSWMIACRINCEFPLLVPLGNKEFGFKAPLLVAVWPCKLTDIMY